MSGVRVPPPLPSFNIPAFGSFSASPAPSSSFLQAIFERHCLTSFRLKIDPELVNFQKLGPFEMYLFDAQRLQFLGLWLLAVRSYGK